MLHCGLALPGPAAPAAAAGFALKHAGTAAPAAGPVGVSCCVLMRGKIGPNMLLPLLCMCDAAAGVVGPCITGEEATPICRCCCCCCAEVAATAAALAAAAAATRPLVREAARGCAAGAAVGVLLLALPAKL